MKSKLHFTRHSSRLALLLALLSTLNPQPSTLFAQGSAFTYQGLLTSGAVPISGSYDYRFGLFPGAGGGLEIAAQTNSGVLVSNGLFIATFDFGTNAFPGSARWLEISVRSNGVGAFGALTPRQQVTATPYAIRAATFSGTVSAGQLTGTLSLSQLPGAVVTNNAGGVILTGTFSGNGGGLTNISVTKLNGYTAADFWRLDGNNVSNGDILGSTNNQAIQFVVNGFNALRLEPNSSALPNVVGGNGNSVSAGVYAAVIGGGFANIIETNATEAVIAGGGFNDIGPGSYNAAIVGGANNKVQTNCGNSSIVAGEDNGINNSSHASIVGGLQNFMLGFNTFSVIGGGNANIMSINASYGAICGGRNNTNAATTSTIAGGEGNSIGSLADRSFIGGGLRNITTGALGMVPGGFANVAGSQAFAAGRRAKANDNGSFVWADSTDADFASSLQNQFNVRASGGYRLYSSSGLTTGVTMAAGANGWSNVSDRNVKENFQPIDCRALLEKVVALPVTTWNLKTQPPEIRHIGAMAQDFKASFAVGEDDRHISTSDADGVTLAAIQGLNQKLEDRAKTLESELEQKETEITKLKRKNDSLEKRLDALEETILKQSSN